MVRSRPRLQAICRRAGHALARAGLLGVLALATLATDARAAFDPLGMNAAAGELREAVGLMDAAASQLPAGAQQTLAAELQLLGRSIDWTLNRVEDQAVPLVERAALHDLNFVADVVASVTDELRQIPPGPVAPATRARLDALAAAASERLERINATTDRWMARTRTAVIELDAEAGAIVVKQIDRIVYDGVRYASLALLLVGLLAIGLRLLRMSEAQVRWSGLLRRDPVPSALALGLLAIFVLGCALLGVWPGALADLSARVEVHAQEHPCQRLDAQQAQLVAAQELQLASLVDATKTRMQDAAQDCLGLPAQAAAEAVEQLATRRVPVTRLAADATGTTIPEPERAPVAGDRPQLASTEDLLAPLSSAAAQEPAAGPRTPPVEPPGPSVAADAPPAPAAAPPAAAEPDAAESDVSEPAEPTAPAPAAAPPPATPPPATASGGSARPPIVLSDLLSPEPEVAEFVTTAGVNYRAAPTVDAPRLGAMPAGTRVRVVRETGGWAEIELSDGRQAFMAIDYLEPAAAAQ